MARLILNCGRCEKNMGSLEPYRVVNDKYMCIPCAELSEKQKTEETQIQQFYDGLADSDIPFTFII
jgi:hypothetical protein